MAKRKPKGKRLIKLQVSLTFDYAENLQAIVKDLESVDRLIPPETSRTGYVHTKSGIRPDDEGAVAIIQARKVGLLRYIQMICRDHIHFSKRLLAKGWRHDG